MADLDSRIESIVKGDECDIIRDIENVPEGSFLTDAWFTVKENHWAVSAIIDKKITSVNSANGRIEDTGDGDTIAKIRFRISKAETGLLHAHYEYDFDIQVKTDSGYVFTPESGKLVAHHQVNTSTTS